MTAPVPAPAPEPTPAPVPAPAPDAPTPAPPTGLADVFPPFGLVVRAGDLTMRLLQDADLPEYGALHFAERRSVGSGSWLTLEEQGQGYGKLMRQAMLVLAFDHLGAEAAESAAIEGNARSFATSHACGYVDNGIGRSTMSGVDAMEQRFRVTPETFIRPAMPVEVEGLTPQLRAMLGA